MRSTAAAAAVTVLYSSYDAVSYNSVDNTTFIQLYFAFIIYK